MSDIEKKASEEAGKGEVDLTKYVPKDEVEKLQATQRTEIEKLRQETEHAKMALLDPDYVSFLESKKAEAGKVAGQIDKAKDKLKDDDLTSQEIKALRETIVNLQTRQQYIVAQMELQNIKERYPDFNDYKDAVAKILETSSTDLTYEQAYKMAKADKRDVEDAKKSEEDKKKEARIGRERPGGAIPSNSEPKTFKSKEAAALDAWDEIVGSGKDSL